MSFAPSHPLNVMTTNASQPDLPNPLTILAWFPPEIEHQVVAGHSVLFGVLGAWIWDVVTSLPEELQMFYQSGVGIAGIVYIVSKLSTGWLIFAALLPGVMPAGHCEALARATAWSAPVQFSTNTLIFFFRVRAVFFRQRIVIVIFALLWLAITGTAVLYPVTVTGTTVGETEVCIFSRLSVGASVVVVITAVNDTLTFLAITLRLLMLSHADNLSWSTWSNTFLTGEGMGRVSRTMMQTGQLYYLFTVGFTVTSATMILVPSIPMGYSDAFMPVAAVVANMMATKVFRELKLGRIQDVPTTARSSIFHNPEFEQLTTGGFWSYGRHTPTATDTASTTAGVFLELTPVKALTTTDASTQDRSDLS